jgi:hypothetical protein
MVCLGTSAKLAEFSAPITVHSAFNSIFGQFALKFGMSADYENVFPEIVFPEITNNFCIGRF